MSAAKALSYLRQRGVEVALDGGDVVLVGVEELPDEAIARLRNIKPELVEELRREAEAALFDPERLQREADGRNAAAIRAGWTDRFCACGWLASTAWKVDGREMWRCDDCGAPQ